MAGQQSRTITLTLDAQTTGRDGVKALADELRKLAKEGGDAAPKFTQLGDELESIANQQQAVEAFNNLSAAVGHARTEMEASRKAAHDQSNELLRLKQLLDQARDAEAQYAVGVSEARNELQSSKQSLLEARAAVSAYAASIGGAKSATREQAAELKVLNQAVRQAKADQDAARASLSQLTPEYNALRDATTAAATEVRKQETALSTLNQVVEKAKTEFEALDTDLNALATHMQKLGVDTTDVVGAQNKLTQSMARLSQEASDLKTKLAEPGNSAATAAARIENAFAVTGVRSTQAIKTEIMKVNSALMTLAQDATVTGLDFDRAFAQGKARIVELENQLKATESASKAVGNSVADAFKQFGPATLVFNGITGAINMLVGAAQKIPQVTMEFETMNRTLKVLTGSTNAAAKEFEYIKGVANRVGSDIKSVGESYIRLTAATKDTALEGEKTKRVFEAVAGSMGMLGASSAETENALMAVTQMVSKGVISMEEFRQQLGERLPGAFQVTSKELGITTAEFNDLISNGKLAADDVLPALAAGLEKMYATGQRNETLRGQWERLKNAMSDTGNTVGETVLPALMKVGQWAAGSVGTLGEGFVFAGKAALSVGDALLSWDVRKLDYAAEEAEKLKQRLRNLFGATDDVKKSLSEQAQEAQKAGQQYVVMGDGTKVATAAILGANDGFIKFLVQSQKAQKSAEDFATSARKVAEYTRSAGEASITAVNAIGTESDKRETATRVAEANHAALQKLVDAEQKVIDLMDAEALRRAEALRDGAATSDAHKKQLTDLGDEITKRKAAIDGLTNQSEANRVLAESLKLEAETLKDNSGRIGELKGLNEEFTSVLKKLKEEVDAGRLSQQQYNVVEEEARKNKRLYLDALDDQIKKSEAVKNAKLSEINIEEANLRLAIEVQKGIINVARARGDEDAAIRATNETKRLEIQMAQLVAQAKGAEATAAKLVAEAKIEEIKASGPLTAAKEAEIQALEASVKVKEIESKIAQQAAKSLEDLKFATDAAANSAGGSTGSFNGMAGSLNGVADAATRANGALQQLNNNRKKGGGTPQQIVSDTRGTMPGIGNSGSVLDDPNYDHSTFFSGEDGSQYGQASRSVGGMDILYRQGATIQEAKIAAKYFDELFRRRTTAGSNSVRSTEDNNRLIAESSRAAAEEAIQIARTELATGQAADLGPSIDDIVQRNLAQLSARGGNFNDIKNVVEAAGREGVDAAKAAMAQQTTVRISIGGQSRAVNVSSQNDAAQLTKIFQQIETDFLRA